MEGFIFGRSLLYMTVSMLSAAFLELSSKDVDQSLAAHCRLVGPSLCVRAWRRDRDVRSAVDNVVPSSIARREPRHTT